MSSPNWWGDWRPNLTPHTGNLLATDLIECTMIVGGLPVNTVITGQQIINAASGGSSSLTVGTTAIASGTIGRVLFQGTGNVLQQSANLFWDNTNGRLGIGTATPSATLHTVGSITASGAIARGNYMKPTLVAAANNDVMVGLDIAPTFTNGAFTGVQNISLRLIGASNRSTSLIAGDSTGNAYITNDITTQMTYTAGYGGHVFRFRDATNSSYPLYVSHNLVHGGNMNTSLGSSAFRWLSIFAVNISADTYQFQGTNAMSFLGAVNTGIYFDLTNKHLNIFTNNSQTAKLFSTGNVAIGTTTDAGFKLDVNGTARVRGGVQTGAIYGSGTNFNLASDAYIQCTSTTGKNAGLTINRFSTSEYASVDLITNASFVSGWSIQMVPSQTRLNIVDRNPSDNVRMCFHNGGNIGIGTTTNAGYKLDVNGSSRFLDKVSIGSPTAASAVLEISSTIQGFLPPRMTTTQKNAIASPAAGLVVYDTTLNKLCVYTTAWETITSV